MHSALGLSVADSLMLGCQPVIVEGGSDQHYLTAIKTLLVASGKLQPTREIVFPPAGGTKNTRMVASILTGRDEALPYMILDGDVMGQKIAKEIGSGLYQDATDRLIIVDDHTGIKGSEIEDLIPLDVTSTVIDRMHRNADVEFANRAKTGTPVVGQIEAWAAEQRISLGSGWKVELSKRVKQHLLTKGMVAVAPEYAERWQRLFAIFAP